MKEDHHQAITSRDNRMQAHEFKNEEHQQKILRFNEEIDDLTANRHVVRRVLTTCCVSSKRIAEKSTHIILLSVSTSSWKNISGTLDFVTQTWGWLTSATIETPFINGIGLSVKWSRNQTITKTISSWQKRSKNSLKLSWMSLFKSKEFCSLHHRQQNLMIKNTSNKDHECLWTIRSHGRT